MDVYAPPAGDLLAAENPQICAFTQEEGEIVYVPDGYFHAVANDANWTVAVGQQAPGGAPGGFVDRFAQSTKAYVAAAAKPQDRGLAANAVRTLDEALAEWPNEPLLHNLKAKVALDVPGAELEPVGLASSNVAQNPRSVDARFGLLVALDRHAAHRRDDIARLCWELHAELLAYDREALSDLEDAVGPRDSKRRAVEKIMRDRGIQIPD